MVGQRREIEDFVRQIVREVEACEAAGLRTPNAIAAHFNARGLTTRKGRRWTGTAMAKFLASPGARRFRKIGASTRRNV